MFWGPGNTNWDASHALLGLPLMRDQLSAMKWLPVTEKVERMAD